MFSIILQISSTGTINLKGRSLIQILAHDSSDVYLFRHITHDFNAAHALSVEL